MTEPPADTDPQVARQFRREPLLMLLSRMQRGVLLDAERPLLRAAVETELADGDQAHTRAAQYGVLLEAAEQAGNTAEKLLPMQPDGDYTDHESYYVVGGWGVDGDTTRAKAVRHARKALIEYPGCQARVDRCVTRTWDDGSQFVGASETIDLDGEPS